MVKVAVISDIHGNLEALLTVFRDIDNRKVDYVFCTGDIVGYYPHPLECIELVKTRCDHIIKGNHDEVVIDENFDKKVKWFNEIAAESLTWTRKHLLNASAKAHFLESLPTQKTIIINERKILLAHGTPEKKWEYFLYPYWFGAPLPEQKAILNKWLKKWELVFIGHTHQPFVYKFRKKLVINPGSVGQPRDGIPKASYALVEIDRNKLKGFIVRLEYDIEETCKSLKNENLHEYLCSRLLLGK
ncbi:MAG: metallophosphoesterase family protein [Candidatus Hodarchaeales archaeon]|jgi:putative phosphoesterase